MKPKIPSNKLLELISKTFYVKHVDDGRLYRKLYLQKVNCDYFETSLDAQGYVVAFINFNGNSKRIRVQNIIWFLRKGYWPRLSLDHRDRDRTNNKLSNLREASDSIQALNRGNKSKEYWRGVTRYYQKWSVSIGYKGKFIYIGLYTTIEEARTAYQIIYDKINDETLSEEEILLYIKNFKLT